jgi:signal transduction histidine kinase/Fe-S-cluster-containing hydrogenase component 2
MNTDEPLVTTIKEKCRRCYACVRECPAKAIRIVGGQASVVTERCIGCGNCVRVCNQNAKRVYSSVGEVESLLDSDAHVAALIAPSFPAEFIDVNVSELVTAIRALGFGSVHEVAFGADLVAREYAKLMEHDSGRYISTACPAVVSYVRKYHPDLVPMLAAIVSPMVACARAVRRLYGEGIKTVFIGPCIAKKSEATLDELGGAVDAVLTFVELRELFATHNVRPGIEINIADADAADAWPFDPPHGANGALFPVTRGLLQSAGLREDLLNGDIVSADGRDHFTEAINDFADPASGIRLLDVLSCQGCVMGVGMTSDEPILRRRARVSASARARRRTLDRTVWHGWLNQFADLDLTRVYPPAPAALDAPPDEREVRAILQRMGKYSVADELNCGACGYETCWDHAVAISRGLAETDMCLPYTIERLKETVTELEESHRSLESTREALVRSEQLASMGQLAAGIAHEVNNPLSILLLQANILLEECAAQSELRSDLSVIVDQANRCKKIISGLLNFARQSRVVRQPTDIPELVHEVLRTLPLGESVTVQVDNRLDDPIAEVDADQIVQVLINLMTNAQQAMPQGGTLRIQLSGDIDTVSIAVTDTGCGIPEANLNKLFTPFFTTKQVGKGTGLGLAVTHGIVKMHRGTIDVTSNADPQRQPTGTTFTVRLPRHEASAQPAEIEV